MKFKKIVIGLLALAVMFSLSEIKGYALTLTGAEVTVENIADLKDSVQNAEMDKVIKLGENFPTVFSVANTFVIAHDFNVTIDGQGKAFTMTGNFRHFDLKNTGTGTLKLTNMTLLGNNTVDGSDRAVKGALGGGVATRDGQYLFDAVHFSLIGGSAIKSMTGNTYVTVNNSTFDYNTSNGGGGAIDFENGGNNLSIHNSAFYKNYTDALGYSGGAIFYKGAKASDIKDSIFLGNETRHLGGAIAYTNAVSQAVISIEHSYFENNKTVDPGNAAYRPWADAGAVGLYSPGAAVKFSVLDSTFTGNSSLDDGGAMMIENPMVDAKTTLTNNTFFKNVANGLGISANPKADAGGGAIQFSLTTNAVLEDNTIVMNKVSGLNTEMNNFGGARGGGIGYHYDTQGTRYPTLDMKNNLMYGNFVTDATDNVMTSDFSNITIDKLYDGTSAGTLIDNGGNIGIDNGTALSADITSENIFGVADSELMLSAVFDDSVIGVNDVSATANPYTIYGMPLLTLLIKDGTNVEGLAQTTGFVSDVSLDANRHERSKTAPDVGALEVFWLKFDANGAAYDLLPSYTYDGTYYYDTTQTTTPYYYEISYLGGSVTALSDTNIVHPEGKTFLGWSATVDGAVEYYAGDEVTLSDNMTLYAQFDLGDTYTLDFDLNGATGTPPAQQVLEEGQLAIAPLQAPQRTGYTFMGWNTSADGSGSIWNFDATTMPANNVTLYAQWVTNTVDTYVLSFNLNGATGTPPAQQVLEEGQLAIAPLQAQQRTGYTFMGWNTSADGSGSIWNFDATTMPANNVTLYAQWIADTVDTYVLSFNLNGATGTVPASQTLEEGQLAIAPLQATQRTGYTFMGWNTSADGSGSIWNFDATTMPANNVTLYAQWIADTVDTYVLSFNLNGATGTAPANQTLPVGSLALVPAIPKHDGYTFMGWNTSADGKGVTWDFNLTRMPASNIILYAQWKTSSAVVTLPKTGQETNAFLLGVLSVLSGSSLLILRGKKQKNN